MKKHYFTILAHSIGMFIALCGSGCSAIAQDSIVGKDVPEGFAWRPAADSQMCFRTVSMDGKKHTFYMKVGDLFAPVDFAPSRALSDRYPAAVSEKIVFYSRHLENGKPVFTPVLNVDTGKAKDFLVAVFGLKNGKYSSACVDLGLEKMPLASFSVINMSPRKMGFSIGKARFALSPFAGKTEAFTSSEAEIKSVTLRTFDLRNAKETRQLLSKTYSFWTNKRMMVFVFDNPKEDEDTALSDEDIPTTVLYDNGPR